jgi:integrase
VAGCRPRSTTGGGSSREGCSASRGTALTPEQVESTLARRPYDLRHAAASLWLNAGGPPTEIARRLGHSVAVLLKVYANCLDGGEDGVNDKIGGVLDR